MDNEHIEEVKQPSEFALRKAATAWCKSTTEMKVMDPDLAIAFAEIIDELQCEYLHILFGKNS